LITGLDSLEACEAACDANLNGCDFVWFKPGIGRRASQCKLFAAVHKFKPRVFKSRGFTYSGRLCRQGDPRILPCDSDWHCYEKDYCVPKIKNCEPKCNGDTICSECESCFTLEDSTQECRADASKCEPTDEPTTTEPTEATEEPTEVTQEPTEATEEPTTADPTMATAEPTTAVPTAAPTAAVWCPTTDKYFNHQGTPLRDVWGLKTMEDCKEACDNEAGGCNFVWYFDYQGKKGRKGNRCRMFGGADFLKPRQPDDVRPVTFAGRLCGVDDVSIFCMKPTHCYRTTDRCNLKERVCEPGLDSPMRDEGLNVLAASLNPNDGVFTDGNSAPAATHVSVFDTALNVSAALGFCVVLYGSFRHYTNKMLN